MIWPIYIEFPPQRQQRPKDQGGWKASAFYPQRGQTTSGGCLSYEILILRVRIRIPSSDNVLTWRTRISQIGWQSKSKIRSWDDFDWECSKQFPMLKVRTKVSIFVCKRYLSVLWIIYILPEGKKGTLKTLTILPSWTVANPALRNSERWYLSSLLIFWCLLYASVSLFFKYIWS